MDEEITEERLLSLQILRKLQQMRLLLCHVKRRTSTGGRDLRLLSMLHEVTSLEHSLVNWVAS